VFLFVRRILHIISSNRFTVHIWKARFREFYVWIPWWTSTSSGSRIQTEVSQLSPPEQSCRCSARATGSYGISCNRRPRRTTRRSWRSRDTANGSTQLLNEWSSNAHTSDAGMASFMLGRTTCARITHSWAHLHRWAVEHYRLAKHIFFVVCRPNLRETCYLTTTVPIRIPTGQIFKWNSLWKSKHIDK